MTIALQVFVSGLAAGGVYGLFAAGHTLIYRLTGMVNFAFGDLVGLGVFATLLVLAGTAPVTQSGAHEPRFLGALIVGLVLCVAAGAATYVGLIQPYLARGSTIGWVAGTAAVAFAIRAAIGAAFQRSSYVFPDPLPFHRVGHAGFIRLGGAQVQARAFFVIGLALALALGSAWLLEKSRFGRALRAVADDAEGARVVGVPVELLIAIAFGLVGALAMIAAIAAARGAGGAGMSALGQTAGELRRAVEEARAGWSAAAWAAVGAVGLAALVPFLSLPGVRVDSLADTVYLAVAATGLGLTVGVAGLPSLGAGAFMAVGAFTSSLLVARSGWPLEPAVLAGAAAALVAGLISGGVVRLRRAFVAVGTWLLAWLVWLFLLAFPSVSGGSQGLILPPKTLFGLDATPTVHLEVALALLTLTVLAIAAVRRGTPGLELSALRQSPRLATPAGVRLRRGGRGALAAAAFGAGLAGALSVQLAAVADPAAYDPFLSFKLLVAVLLGGAAATLGPAAGVAALALIGLASDPLARLLQLPLERFDTAVAALLLVFVLALGGGGIVPWLEPRLARLRNPRA